ncbi:MAG: hypothetical protein ASARMPRED_006207 [Alectoria sarmentosa]|nr:MAG: hypothetical protein ASARMPRED_006207 [Alectoria sarmentosa]
MFEQFSFACASRQHAVYDPYPMDDPVSPTSSRESTPCYDNGFNSSPERYPLSTSIAELSQHFDQQTLTPRRPSICIERSAPRARELNPPQHSPNSFSNRVCRRRQSLNRLQCSSDHLSRISALVEEMVHTGQPVHELAHPAAPVEDSTSPSLSPDEIPPMASYFNMSSSSSYSANGDMRLPQHSLRHSQSYKIDKDLRHSGSREGIGKPLVKKKIRMRKSLKALESGGKSCER